MPRVIWKGAISFSLIHIPVSLHSATKSSVLDLDLLDRRDFAPVGYQRINKNTGKSVEWEEIVKGFQYEKEKYVALSDEDFRLANVEATRTIEIMGFVDPTAVAPPYFDTPYYLAAEKRGEKVYTLFREVLDAVVPDGGRNGRDSDTSVCLRNLPHGIDAGAEHAALCGRDSCTGSPRAGDAGGKGRPAVEAGPRDGAEAGEGHAAAVGSDHLSGYLP